MFTYDPAVLERFPTIRAGVVHLTDLVNDPVGRDLHDAYRRQQQDTLARLRDTAIAELPSISAWRRAFSAFGVKPTQHRNAAESLLRRLTKAGDIPSINPLVDIGIIVSIRHALPVAVLDLAGITGTTTVRFAEGTEPFTDLGATDPTTPDPGEVVFVDEAGVVSARRWCWRQSAQSATGPGTTAALALVEGLHDRAADDVAAAAADLADLLATHIPTHRVARVALLSAAEPHL